MVEQTIAPLDLERMVELDFVRTTEAAALNAYHWLGKGDPQAAHAAAVDAMRGTLDVTCISATVICGDGLKRMPGGIEDQERLGNWQEGTLQVDLAAMPIDGINLVARGLPGAMVLLASAYRKEDCSAFFYAPCQYMEKIAYGSAVAAGPARLHLEASVRDNLEIIADKLNKRVQDLNVAVLDRKRHEELIDDIRKAGASVRLISDGDVAACIAPSLPASGLDVYMGTGGSAEAVLASAAIKCLGGDLLTRMAPVDEQEKENITETLSAAALQQHYHARDLVGGDSVVFCATGISDSQVLNGVRVEGNAASTYSVVMRARYRTVRYIKATHDLSRKTIRLRSAGAEAKL